MGAGRKGEKRALKNKPVHQPTWNVNPYSARHLVKQDLAGVIFGCTHSTFKECNSKQLFGLPAFHFKYVKNITPGLPLFLFNYSDRTLHGIYEATTAGQMDIDRHAWTFDGEDMTAFPAQVRVKIHKQCKPLSEDQYKPILAKNYLEHEPKHLWFELDKGQTHKLISLFSTSLVSPRASLPSTAAKCGTLLTYSATPATNIDMDPGLFCNSTKTVEGEDNPGILLDQDIANVLENEKKWSSLFEPQSKLSFMKECEDSTSEGLSVMSTEEPLIVSEATLENAAPPVISEMLNEAETLTVVSEATCLAEEMSSNVNSNLRAVVDKLLQDMGEIKELHSRQTQKIRNLEEELEEAKSKLQKFKSTPQESRHSGSSLSASHSEKMQLEIQDGHQSLLLVGGFDGSSWLQNLDRYSPFEDVMRPLAHMKSVRSYASAVELNEKLYVLGGGYDSCWYDTVELYNLESNQWSTCPALNRKKGNLAAASLGGKIFAIGGGNTTDCFSEVEILDLHMGKWMVARAMLKERFAPAAAELNGVLYAAGGFDGHEYLSSVERFDPRACSWTRLKNMNSRRGCHSLTVLNEKLYAIGGYDGNQMVPTVEVFEPRTGSWTLSQPMTCARGYLGAVNVGEKIYAIGGMQQNNDILDTVECYSEGEGWKLAQLKSMGKRCFFSAVTV